MTPTLPPEVQVLCDAQDAAGKLFQRDAELRAAHAAALSARKRIASSPPPTEEVVANMRAVVDEHAAKWLLDNSWAITLAFAGERRAQRDGSVTQQRPTLWRRAGHFLDVPDLVGLVPEMMKVRFEAAIRSRTAEAGPEADERARIVAELDGKIAAIERTHSGMVDAAAALTPPISLSLLESVRARREIELERQKRDGEAAEAARRAAAVVNEKLPRTATRSSYLRHPPQGETIPDPFGT